MFCSDFGGNIAVRSMAFELSLLRAVLAIFQALGIAFPTVSSVKCQLPGTSAGRARATRARAESPRRASGAADPPTSRQTGLLTASFCPKKGCLNLYILS